MPRNRKNYHGLVSAAVFLILEIAALSMLSRSSGLQNIWAKRFSYRAKSVLWRSGESIRNYFSLKSQNELLSKELFALEEEVRAYRNILSLQEAAARTPADGGGFRYTPATIVKMSRNSQHNYIVLDKGSEDGITPMSGIISERGVVGIIDAVDKHYSYGLTLLNADSQVSARLGREGVVAPLKWDGLHSDGAFLENIPLHHQVMPGDTVWTSGFSSIFPAGIPLGAAGEVRMMHGSTGRVKVRLFQDFSTLRFVSIVQNTGMANIDRISEEKGGGK